MDQIKGTFEYGYKNHIKLIKKIFNEYYYLFEITFFCIYLTMIEFYNKKVKEQEDEQDEQYDEKEEEEKEEEEKEEKEEEEKEEEEKEEEEKERIADFLT